MLRPILSALLLALAAPAAWAQTATIVFESGLGDGASVWRKTIAKLGGAAPVFTYDRPGYRSTPASTTPRDPCTIARELHDRLAAAGKAPPYLLVGHSLGGQYAYAFARQYPDAVAGLVLVDATPPGHLQALRNATPAAGGILKLLRATVFSGTMRREFDAQDQCLSGLPQPPLPFPVRVLVKTKGDPMGGKRLLTAERQMAQRWLVMTGARRIEPIEGSGHYIQRDRAGILADIIAGMAGVYPGATP